MKTGSVVGLLLLLVSSWVAAGSDAEPEEKSEVVELSPEIEKLLSETSDPDEYSESSRCINTHRIRTSQILDDRQHVSHHHGHQRLIVQRSEQHQC